MANVRNSNTFYVDAASTGASDSISRQGIRLTGLVLTPNAAGDVITLNDLTSGPGAGSLKLTVKATANGTEHIDLSGSKIIFPNGIWVSAITANAVATLILEEPGA